MKPGALAVAGVESSPLGQTLLRGPAAALFERLDARFASVAQLSGAEPMIAPAFCAPAALDRIGYFSSFPHLATFAVSLANEDANLEAFAAGPVEADGALRMGRLSPVRAVLTPAACYHVYPSFEGARLDGPALVTLRAACFRRETHFEPLRRLANFQMREVVCLGALDDVKEFLSGMRASTMRFAQSLGLAAEWVPATDPFFGAAAGKALMQEMDPVKMELVVDGIAIASTNLHRNVFGEAFHISHRGKVAHSGCAAFGLERWLGVLLRRHGSLGPELLARLP